MKKSLFVLVGLVVLALGAAAFWSLVGGRARSGDKESASPVERQPASTELASTPAPAELDAPATEPLAARADETTPEREASSEGSAGRVLSGFVRIPEGAPADEGLRVLALREALTAERIYGLEGVLAKSQEPGATPSWRAEARVESDGRFRLVLADREPVFLAVVGRFLYSDVAQPVAPDEDAPLLTATLGAVVTGQVSLPAGVDPAATFASLKVRLGPDRSQISLAAGRADYQSRIARTAAAGAFELCAVPITQRNALTLLPETCARAFLPGLDLAAGEVRHVELTLELGATLRGMVQDDRGVALAGAEVQAAEGGMWGFTGEARSKVESDAEGRFVLLHVPAGKSLVVAEKKGYLESDPLDAELVNGEDRSGLVLVLGRGASVAGHVRLPDGSPAGGAQVRVSFDLEAMMGAGAAAAARGANGQATADEQGEFEVTGLGRGPFTVAASLERPAADGEKDTWSGKRSKVAPDSHSLEIVLAEPCTVRGRVVTSTGAPVERFHVEARLPGVVFFDPGTARGQDVVAADGAFVLRGLEPGKWQLSARAAGFGPMAPLALELPRTEAEPLVLTLLPEARVLGRVLGPDGQPVAGATVSPPGDLGETMRRMRDASDVPQARSDADGKFVLSGLGPEVSAIRATHERYAPSEAADLQLAPGQTLEGLELRLQHGARVTLEVYDREGGHASDVQVVAQNRGTMEMSLGRTDARGEHVFERLAAGPWTISAILGEASLAQSGDAPEQSSANLMDNLRFEMVDLVEGDDKHLVLGKPPEKPVVVHGLVRHGQDALDRGLVSFVPDGMKSLSGMKMASIGTDGTFRVELDGPGAYIVNVQVSDTSSAMQQNTVEYRELVPEVEEHRLTLALPLGGIRGTVRDAAGAPVAGAQVTLTTEGGVQTGSMLGGQYAQSATDANGVYRFRFLRPGRYTVAAGGALFGGAFGSSATAGRRLRKGLVVGEASLLEDIDFELPAACDLHGRVRDTNGAPVKDASIFVRDGDGNLLDRFSMITSSADGRFTYTGMAAGEYLVSARTKDQASGDSAPVRVEPDHPGEVELVVLAGTRLVVEVLGDDDQPVQAFVTVLDEHKREVQGMLGFSELTSSFAQGFDSTVQRIGPVPPGAYTVVALGLDGRRAQKPVKLDGQAERRLTLRLKD